MRWPSVWLAASSAVLIVAGCGGSSMRPRPAPRIPAAVAQRLAADADAVAAQPGCAANDLVSRIPQCPPPEPQGNGKGKHGHGKHKGHDDED